MCDFHAVWFEIHLMPHLLLFFAFLYCFYDEVAYCQRYKFFPSSSDGFTSCVNQD